MYRVYFNLFKYQDELGLVYLPSIFCNILENEILCWDTFGVYQDDFLEKTLLLREAVVEAYSKKLEGTSFHSLID